MLEVQPYEILNVLITRLIVQNIRRIFTKEQVPKLQIENLDLKKHTDVYVIIRNKKFELDENDSIFAP